MARAAREPEGSTEQVVSHVRTLIERGRCALATACRRSGISRLQIGVSRPTVRAGLRALAAMGVVQSRHGSGTFISVRAAFARHARR